MVDGNVIRVLCRMRAIGGDIQNRKVISHLWSLSNALVDEKQPGDFNQVTVVFCKIRLTFMVGVIVLNYV